MKWFHRGLWLLLILCLATPAFGQLFRRQHGQLDLIYYDKQHEYLTYHLARSFENSLSYHRKLFDYTPTEPIVILFQDFGDYGHGGTSTVPWNYLSIGIEPFDYVYETMPANERMNWLMHHELVHVVATDKGADRDLTFRRLFGGKVAPEQEAPLAIFYSYLTSPRWYAPRWYHEGIAVFLETWMAGGMGRALGGYDEMVFRTMVLDDAYFYDVVGLESEGKTIDFQVGQNSYLYGTRFMSYLADQYGPEKLMAWVNRTPGSKAYFSSQFKKVYGTSLDAEWEKWIAFEKKWQATNLEEVRKYPTSTGDERRITKRALGSVSRSYYDRDTKQLYAAVNFPGSSAQVIRYDPESGKGTKLTDVTGPALYYVASLAYDAKGKKLFYTTDNSRGWRDINEINLATGKRRMLLKDARTGDLVINPADQSLWGVQHHNGLSTLLRIPPPYKQWSEVLTLDYGRDIFDLDISPDGKTLSSALIDVTGRQQLVVMSIEKLLAGDSSFDVVYEFANNAPENFVFSPDGRYLYGSSYYSGVSNIFRIELATKKLEALTNAESGYFRPMPISDDRMFAYRYMADGFVPVTLPIKVHEDVNAVRYLGQDVVEKHPELKGWKAGSPGDIDLDTVTTSVGEYHSLKAVRFASMFPIVEGYKDSAALGMRFNFSDPLGLQSFKVNALVGTDGSLPSDEKYHVYADYNYQNWEATFGYNATDFYDLFGPTKVSRKGYATTVSYDDFLIFERPRTLDYSLSVGYYADLDTLPDFQNVPTAVSDYVTGAARLDYKNLKRTIGAVDVEKGVEWSLRARVNYVESEVLPRVYGTFDVGVPLPLDHSSLWLRTAAGSSFNSEPDDEFGNFYFGGFGNNYVDYKDAQRFHEYYSFPGVEINEIPGTDFGKAMLEWTLPAMRFRRLGVQGIYANWARLSLFGSGLVTDMTDDELRRENVNVGGQIDVSVVLFSNLDAMLSFGYARAFEHGDEDDEVMISLRLLK
ncbi:MAG: hypothetical protein WC538_14975 [Thermoanaerobaculia bacterium]|jgi:hypothetical protein